MKSLKNKRSMAFLFTGMFILAGVYNAVVINSHSEVSEGKFLKRLDEMSGVVISGRNTASVVWHKLEQVKAPVAAVKVAPRGLNKSSAFKPSEPAQEDKVAAIQEELKLHLVEVVNPTKFAKGLPNTQFSGNVNVNNGVIDSLTVNLPNFDALSVSFSELNGNVFSYDYAGGNYSGMMYQVDSNTYMVSLTNGPLEGTRLRFAGDLTPDQQETEAVLAQDHNVQVGSFGNQSELHSAVEGVDAPVQQNIQAQTFNMESEQVVQ